LRALHDAVSEADGARLVAGMTETLNRLAALPFPVIAAIDGAARGGGAEIALSCDLRIMASDATIGFVQISLGLMPGWGGARRLWQQVGYSRALLWLTTGAVLTAEEAKQHGRVEELAPPGKALPAALELAERIAAQHPPAVRAIKRTLRNYAENVTPPWAAQAERDAFPPLWADAYHLRAVEQFLQRKSGKLK
jgi:enoyl-CoA hydratase